MRDVAENDPHLKRNILESRVEFPFHISPRLKDLISLCLALTAKDRPTIRQVREHPWMLLHENTASS